MSQSEDAIRLVQEVQVSSADVLPSHTRTVSLGRPHGASHNAASFGGTTWIRSGGQEGTRFVSWRALSPAFVPLHCPVHLSSGVHSPKIGALLEDFCLIYKS